MDDSEFEADKKINPEQLDVEAATQAEIFFKWAERSVEARMDMDRAKMNLEVLDATLQIRARKMPEKFGISKLTEGAIHEAIQIDERHLEAYNSWLKTKETSLLMDKAVEAMEQRKRMIELLVTLHGQNYFAGPSVPRDLVSAWKENQQRREDRTREKQAGAVRRRKSEEEKDG